MPLPAGHVLKQEAVSEELPALADSVGTAPAASAQLNKAVAPASSSFAARGRPEGVADCPEDTHTATPHVKDTKPAAQSASALVIRHCQGQLFLQRKIFHPPCSQTSNQLYTGVGGSTDSPVTSAGGKEHVHSPEGANVTTSKQSVTLSGSGEAVHRSASAAGVPAGSLQEASQWRTAKRALPEDLPAPKGLNGLLLSQSRKRSQKRRATTPVPSPASQAAPVDLTMSDDDIVDSYAGNTKRIKSESREHVHGHSDRPGSLALMVQMVNRRLAETKITVDQLQRLQDAVDDVSELKALQPQELTHVLTSVGGLEIYQKIFVREYLNSL